MSGFKAVFSITSIRWQIYSLINIPSEDNKMIKNRAMEELKWKHIWKTQVVKSLEQGAKMVGSYNGVPCCNCYVYGEHDFYGSKNGCCMNCSSLDMWMSYRDYQRLGKTPFNSYEEFKIERKIIDKKEERKHIEYIGKSYSFLTNIGWI